MNWKFPIVGLLVFFSIQFGCKKSDNKSQMQNLLISEAQKYFENHVQNQPAPNSISPSEELWQKIGRSPLWSKAYKVTTSYGDVVVVPMQFLGKQMIQTSNSNYTYKIDGFTKLCVYKDDNNLYHAEVVTRYPDSTYLLGKSTFSGNIAVRTWQGVLLSYFKQNSTGLHPIPGINFLGVPTPSRYNQKQIEDLTITSCTIYEGYNYAPCCPGTEFSYTEEVCNSYDVSGGSSSSYVGGTADGPVSVIASDGSGGGGPVGTPENPTPGIDSIADSLHTTCFKNMLNKLLNGNLKNDLTNILVNDLGASEDVIYEINERDSTDAAFAAQPAASAVTRYQNNGGLLVITTTLNSTVMANYSEESTAETILHEGIHAYYNFKTILKTEMLQHNSMISFDVDCEVTCLQGIFPSLSLNDARCMILGGFNEEQTLGTPQWNWAMSHYDLTTNEVYNTNISYQNGTLGTKCQ